MVIVLFLSIIYIYIIISSGSVVLCVLWVMSPMNLRFSSDPGAKRAALTESNDPATATTESWAIQ